MWAMRGCTLVGRSFVKAGFRSTTKRRDGHKERGGSFTEATIITPCFLIVILLSIQFMIISFRAVTLQWITTVVMRDIALWNISASQKSSDSTAVYNYGQQRANSLASSIGIELDRAITPPAYCVTRVSQGAGCTNTWQSGDTLQLQLRYNIPLFFTRLFFVNIPTQTVTGTAVAVAENLPQNN